jgi:hypothetical protein
MSALLLISIYRRPARHGSMALGKSHSTLRKPGDNLGAVHVPRLDAVVGLSEIA